MSDSAPSDPRKPAPRARAILIRVSVLLGAMLVGFILCEIGLIVFGFSHTNFYQWDDVTGSSLRPGARGWYRDEGEAFVTINGRGLRDRPHALEKPEDVIRIAIIGDSYAAAFEVDAERAFWSVLENNLASSPDFPAGREPEVINFGMPGHGTAQELLTLRHRVWAYDPDVIVLAFYAGNDVRDNSRALDRGPMRPYFVLDDGGGLVLDDSFAADPAFLARRTATARAYYWIASHLRTVQLFQKVKARRRQAQVIEAESGGDSNDREDGATRLPALSDQIFLPPTNADWQSAWEVTEALIATMSAEVTEHGAAFLVVGVTSDIQVHPDPEARRASAKRIGVDDLLYPNRRLAELADREGFAWLDLEPKFRMFAEDQHTYLHGFGEPPGEGHWNAEGHRLAGELIARKIIEDGIFAVNDAVQE